jgi:GNAT superfamily N-acetyltransferase
LFSSPARLHAWVAVDEQGCLVGYATATLDYSTWMAREFMHLDCLFVSEQMRSRGVGAQLLGSVCDHARKIGITEVQWQTPQWNADAQRFYERVGAAPKPKVRFTLNL